MLLGGTVAGKMIAFSRGLQVREFDDITNTWSAVVSTAPASLDTGPNPGANWIGCTVPDYDCMVFFKLSTLTATSTTAHIYKLPRGYATAFPLTEAPISESSAWVHGNNAGSGSTGPSTTPARCFAPAADGVDYIATVPNRFTTNKHFAQHQVRRQAGYTAPDTQECELLVGFTLSSGVSTGYELDFWFNGTLQAVRWNNGAAANNPYDFTAVTVVSGTWPGTVDGDVVKAIFDSTSGSPIIQVYLNNVLKITFTDTTAGKILNGSPGIGFFARTGAGYSATGYCITAFSAGSV
jgi:hypothetical protein